MSRRETLKQVVRALAFVLFLPFIMMLILYVWDDTCGGRYE